MIERGAELGRARDVTSRARLIHGDGSSRFFRIHPHRSRVVVSALIAGALVAGALAACAPAERDLILVPEDAPTLQAAVAAVAPGGLILVESGTYRESVTIDKPGVTLRGSDRNGVVIDGEGIRPEGIVVIADGVRVENLTVHSHTFNGVLVTGLHDGNGARAHGIDGYTTLDPEAFPPLQGFAIDHVTSYNNGLYGIYAFDSQHGSITNSYASGSADSGFYVGQCEQCDIVVSGNTAENNAVGFEAANASDSLVVVGNRWSGNRVGMTLLSNYQEAFVPQSGVTVAGNLIANNVSSESPQQAEGGFGVGIGIQGSNTNRIEGNRISGNPVAGIMIAGSEDLSSVGNIVADTVFDQNGVDVVNVSTERAPAADTCVRGDASRLPHDFGLACSGSDAAISRDDLPDVVVPPGMSFLRVPAPPEQASLAGDLRVIPDPLPTRTIVPDLTRLVVPDEDWSPGR